MRIKKLLLNPHQIIAFASTKYSHTEETMVNYKNKLTFINNPVLLKAFKVPLIRGGECPYGECP